MRRHATTLRILTVVLASAAAATSASLAAVRHDRPAGRFDRLVAHRAGGSIGVEALRVEDLDRLDDGRLAWDEFRSRHGGRWTILIDRRSALPPLVAGPGVPVFDRTPDRLDAVDAGVREFLAANHAALGEWDDVLALDLDASGRISSDHWQLVYRQLVDGVQVENSRLDVHVKQGRMVMLGGMNWAEVTTVPRPTLTAGDAVAALEAYLGDDVEPVLDPAGPRLQLVALSAEGDSATGAPWSGPHGGGISHALVWRMEFSEPGGAPRWIAEVDAHDGGIVSFFDGARYGAVRGGVFPISNDGDCASGGCEIAGFPLPYADFTESGLPESFADEFGNLACQDPLESFETNLEGPSVRIVDACGPLVESDTCEDGIDLGMKVGENCSVDPFGSPGNSAASRTAYYHVNRVFEVARAYDSTSPWLQEQVEIGVNGAGSCNAFWNGTIQMLSAGAGCGNTGELSGVLVHEWGHGYDFNDGGGEDRPSEAYADVVSIFYNRDSCISRGWYDDGRTCSGYGDTCLTCTGVRDHDWAAREANTPATPSNFSAGRCPPGPGGPCGREAHCEAYPIGEAIYDLATRDLPAAGLDEDTAWQLAERLWYSTRLGSGGNIYDCFRPWLAHSCFAYSWMQRMRVADDDDGDLSNGTPHAAAIFAAFDRHEIACGAAGDPENQSTSSCPPLAAPLLSVTELPGAGTQLSWPAVAGAQELRVYRGELGCDRQQVPIASLPGGATGYLDENVDPGLPRFYRAEAFGAGPACHGPVSECVATPLAARLQPLSFSLVEGGVVNGTPDPGETVAVPVTAFNAGTQGATAAEGTIGFVDPSQGDVLVGNATWGFVPAGGTLESDAPHFQVRVADSVSCGDTVSLDVETWAGNSVAARRRFAVTLGEAHREFTNEEATAIPEQTTGPVQSVLAVGDDEVIGDIDVEVEIAHDVPTELVVELTSPQGTTVRLHDRSAGTGSGLSAVYDSDRAPDGPGTMQDFAGEATAGDWILSIEDLGSTSSAGTLTSWTLHLTAAGAFDCEEADCSASPPAAADGLRVGAAPVGVPVDLVLDWQPVAGAAGYRVLTSGEPAFGAGSAVAGETDGATTLVLSGGVASTPDVAFFVVRAVNECGIAGP